MSFHFSYSRWTNWPNSAGVPPAGSAPSRMSCFSIEGIVYCAVELGDDRFGRALGREETEPGTGLETGQAVFDDRRHFWKRTRPLRAAHRDRQELARLDVLDDRGDSREHELHAAHEE